MFPLNRMGNGNDDNSSEEYFDNLKAILKLLLELLIFIQIF